ncbi:MAG: rRNA adenine N-6-methyltransferase family protein, partial [Candidatus Omnitrophota bacterium]|nr:rRNA adenine N-6-methyltransferase family protein [Candidatus Omnitrophota bacterium]
MHIKPKKRLGQNFLTDKNIQRKLIASYNLQATDRVLEIGAGYGELTKLIARNADFVYALEIDPELCRIFRSNSKGHPNIKIINRDILKFNLKSYFKGLKNKIKVVGNIPYYITTPIIECIFKYRDKIESV